MLNSADSGKFSWPMALTLVALIAAVLIIFIFYRTETWPMRATHHGIKEAEQVARDLKNAFVDIAHLQPRITINNRVYLEETIPTTELVVLARRIEVEHELVHTWAGSSKRVKLNGTFNAKAGFDLRQDLSIDIRPDQIVVQIPHAQILSVEQQQVDVSAFENGFWNRISAEDLQNELSILPHLARQKAMEADLATQAERTLEQQLAERIHIRQPLHLIFTSVKKKDE